MQNATLPFQRNFACYCEYFELTPAIITINKKAREEEEIEEREEEDMEKDP